MGYDDLKTIEAKKFLAAVVGGPQDNEWAIGTDGQLWLLQSRDE